MGDYFLKSGESIGRGQCLARGAGKLCLQSDGNLVFLLNGKALWSTQTKGATVFQMQSDGNAVLAAGHQALWSTRTGGNQGAQLNLDPAGRLIVYKPAGGGKWSPIRAVDAKTVREGLLRGEAPHLVPDPMKIVKSLGHVVTDAAHLKVKRSVMDLGHGVNQITGSSIIQAAFPVVAPANIVNGAVTGGSKGAMKAAQSFLKNPIAKATYAAVGIILPPLAPVSAGIVAGMEATSRLLDGLNSKDPKMVASAALQLAVTAQQAKDGIPGAQRTMDLLEKNQKAQGIVELIGAGDGAAIKGAADLKKAADAGDKKAQAAHHVLSIALLRNGVKTQKPAVKAAGKASAPNLLAQVHAAMHSPHGLRLGKFSVLRTGRVLHNGKALPHKSHHKTAKAAHKVTGGGLHPSTHAAKKAVPHDAHLPR